MNEKWSIIEVFQHTRHDWLNRLQLIKGNIALGKIEQAERIMDDITMDMRQENRLTNLQMPKFSELLLTHNWKGQRFAIEYEIMYERALPLDDHLLSNWARSFLNQLNDVANPIHDNLLYLTIESDLDNIRFLFHFNGIIDNTEKLEQWLTYGEHYPKKAFFQQIGETEYVIEITFK